ncbi:SRPBCC domain-containing protein [uncultured Tateyamaria sp.]|uniref:SRPBCC family protein n=1 Tax=uncultured Tateyamaria sp. TaxID=455651 RepID=UPI0026323E8B|nr:SRPBCC domain-containing protein [uncultured Tateyamaria sp.]
MTDTTLQKTIFLKAPRQLVWEYLTQPEHLAKWFHAPKTPMAEGQALEMFGTTSGDLLIWGTVVKADAPDYLEYTFTVGPMGDAVSTVKWTLSDVPGGTQLSLVHEGLPQGEAAFSLTLALDKGWDDHLMRLRTDMHGDD